MTPLISGVMSHEKGDKQLHTYQVITLRVEGE